MRAAICIALALGAVGCTSTRSCKPNTVFVRATYTGAAATADTFNIYVSVDGGASILTTLKHSATSNTDTVEVDFPSGYPAGHVVAISIEALSGGSPVGAGSAQVTLSGSCEQLIVPVSPANMIADIGIADLSGSVADLLGQSGPDIPLVILDLTSAQPDLNAAPTPDLAAVDLYRAPGFYVHTSPTTEPLYGIWGTSTGSDIFISGAHGKTLHSGDFGASWTLTNTGSGSIQYSIWGTSATNVFTTTDFGTFYNSVDRAATWQEPAGSETATSASLYGIGGAGKLTYVVGASGAVLTPVGATWTAQTFGFDVSAQTFRSVFGVPCGDFSCFFIAGSGGSYLENNAGTWSLQSTGSASSFDSVYGLTSQEIFLVGSGGIIEHTTNGGTNWNTPTLAPTNGKNLFSIWMSGVADIYVAAESGLLLHSTDDGDTFAAVVLPAAATGDLLGVWGSGPNDVWVVGAGGLILHYPN